MLRALLLTLAVEVPLYTAALTLLRLAGAWRAAALAVLVNLVTHPALWLFLAPHPSAARLWSAEAVATAIEAAILIKAINRDKTVLAVIAVGANASSLAIGLLAAQ
ncbi:hypothetical protein [Dactylosporangium darangshiense]|uniref:Uncharacterized protein n=1 Tax=Dactylosporangium darangshiense TaxID=579108 RepID=A0ABP8CX03_9ACTN